MKIIKIRHHPQEAAGTGNRLLAHSAPNLQTWLLSRKKKSLHLRLLKNTEYNMNNSARIGIQVGLIAVAIVLAVMVYRSIMQPVRFEKEKNTRTAVLVQQMKDIRTVQQAYKGAYGRYINTPDSLILFLETGTIPYVKMIGTVPDTLTEEQAIEMGIVSRDTLTENAYDYLFLQDNGQNKDRGNAARYADKSGFLANLFKVPYNMSGKTISMEAGYIDKSGYKVPVFEATVPFEVLLEGMDDNLLRNEIINAETYNKYPGVKVGSMTEAITEGNWE